MTKMFEIKTADLIGWGKIVGENTFHNPVVKNGLKEIIKLNNLNGIVKLDKFEYLIIAEEGWIILNENYNPYFDPGVSGKVDNTRSFWLFPANITEGIPTEYLDILFKYKKNRTYFLLAKCNGYAVDTAIEIYNNYKDKVRIERLYGDLVAYLVAETGEEKCFTNLHDLIFDKELAEEWNSWNEECLSEKPDSKPYNKADDDFDYFLSHD